MMMPALFAGFGAILLVSSLLVILHRNPVTSALFLVLAFCSLAGIYLTMHAEFVGLVQIIVYAGAIMVLFLFVIMYLNLGHDVDSGVPVALRRGLGWIAGGVLLAEAVVIFRRPWAVGPLTPDALVPVGNTQALGRELFSRYLFPFEITSMVLLVAMVGAIVIAKGRRAPTAAVPAVTVSAAGRPAAADVPDPEDPR